MLKPDVHMKELERLRMPRSCIRRPLAVFIHDVISRSGTKHTGPERRRKLAEQGVFVFDSYAEAAAIAYRVSSLPQCGCGVRV